MTANKLAERVLGKGKFLRLPRQWPPSSGLRPALALTVPTQRTQSPPKVGRRECDTHAEHTSKTLLRALSLTHG